MSVSGPLRHLDLKPVFCKNLSFSKVVKGYQDPASPNILGKMSFLNKKSVLNIFDFLLLDAGVSNFRKKPQILSRVTFLVLFKEFMCCNILKYIRIYG